MNILDILGHYRLYVAEREKSWKATGNLFLELLLPSITHILGKKGNSDFVCYIQLLNNT
jgi:hypothetical protein